VYSSNLPVFYAGWLADYQDPHDWATALMSPEGYYGVCQSLTYGLNPTSLIANWPSPADYGPGVGPGIVYASSIPGVYVDSINNSYVDQLIAYGAHAPTNALANDAYQELQDIFYAEAATLPVDQPLTLHFERDWIQGWVGGYSNNPIAPGPYFYQMWKGYTTPVTFYPVTVSVSITNVTDVYPIVITNDSNGNMLDVYGNIPVSISYSITVTYLTGATPVWVSIDLFTNDIELPIKPNKSFCVASATVLLYPPPLAPNGCTQTFTWSNIPNIPYPGGIYNVSVVVNAIGCQSGVPYIVTPPASSSYHVKDVYYTPANMLVPGALPYRVGDLGSGLPPQFGNNFDGVCNGKDYALFLQCYHGTAPAKYNYLADLGGGIPPTFFEYDGKVDGKDFVLFLLLLWGKGPKITVLNGIPSYEYPFVDP
jgi:hypothetical protein